MTVAVPGATPVNVATQVPDVSEQLALTVPIAVFDEVKPTLPPGTFVGVVVSATVTVQVEVPVGTIELGLQATLVEVLSLLVTVTVIVAEVLVLML